MHNSVLSNLKLVSSFLTRKEPLSFQKRSSRSLPIILLMAKIIFRVAKTTSALNQQLNGEIYALLIMGARFTDSNVEQSNPSASMVLLVTRLIKPKRLDTSVTMGVTL